MRKSASRTTLPSSLTDSLVGDPHAEMIRRAAEIIGSAMKAMHGKDYHITFGDDFSFVLVIRDFSGEADR